MNHIHRSVWSPALGTCVATSEHVRGQAHSASSGTASGSRLLAAMQLLASALALVWGSSVGAAPIGGQVSAGQASIAGVPNSLVIQQVSERVSINWQSFGIAAGESVQFVQPSRSSVALNRVLGADASVIMGNLSANGQVFLINPNGILFGKGSSVSVGGLIASTLALSDQNAQAGRYLFAGAGQGTVVNQGDIQVATGGYVALMARNVSNTGTVVAPLGTVAFAAGDAVNLDISGDQLINVSVERGVADAYLSNGGWVQADGGLVVMTAQVAGDVLSNAVNNTGVLQAQTVGERNGTIVLLAGMEAGSLDLSGTIDVSAGATQVAGRVVATAHQVSLTNAQINASGDAGGGSVLIGGGYQGRNPGVPNADVLAMDAQTRISADAQTRGDGGLVVLWANSLTQAHGVISARGGTLGGNGGLVETSGHRLDVSGLTVDTRASQGSTGDWLLDPADITISSDATADTSNSSGTFAPDSGVGAANINVGALAVALGLSNVIITTANNGVSGGGQGDINVDAAITWTAPTTLTLNAERDIHVNQAITGTNGSLALNAGRDVNVNRAISTTTGHLSFLALQDVNLDAATTVVTGNLRAVADRHVNVTADSTVTTGDIVLRADNDGDGPGADAGTVTIGCGASCLTITTGELNIRFNPVRYTNTATEILAYARTLTGGGRLNAKAWVFGQGVDKTYDGTTTATVNGLKSDVTGGDAPSVLDDASNAFFDDPNVGDDWEITYNSSFGDPDYALFATDSMPDGTYQARANIGPLSSTDADPTTETDPSSDPSVSSDPGTVPSVLLPLAPRGQQVLPVVRTTNAVPRWLAVAPQRPTPQGPLTLPVAMTLPLVKPVPALNPPRLVLPEPPHPPQSFSPRPVFVPRTLPLLRVPKQDRN